jgi:predicted O-methyltransferase YrrM
MRVGGLVAVCNDIVLGSRRRVVELGSGTSTVLIARLLQQQWPDGGHQHVAVEHDAAWLQWVVEQLAREGLSEGTTVVHAPLVRHDLAADGLLWYDSAVLESGLDACLGEEQIDLLVVDGPPADTSDKVLARYPALPALVTRLAAGATVVLDDVERPGEQEVLRRWTHQHGLSFTAPDVHAGIAVGTVPPAPGAEGR